MSYTSDEEFILSVWKDIQDSDEKNKYVVLYNPKNRNTAHVLDPSREPIDGSSANYDVRKGPTTKTSNIKSICGRYTLTRSQIYNLKKEYNELSEIMTKEEIINKDDVCSFCQNKL